MTYRLNRQSYGHEGGSFRYETRQTSEAFVSEYGTAQRIHLHERAAYRAIVLPNRTPSALRLLV